MGIKKSALQSLILHSKQFVKNIQICDLGALKWKKSGKSQNSPVFSFSFHFGYYSLFCKINVNMNGSLDKQHILRRKKKTPFATVNFDFS